MNSGEAFVKPVSDTVHKEFGSVKVVFDISCVIVAVVLSLIFFDFHVMGAREGTIIAAVPDSSSSSGTSSCGSRSRSSSLSESFRCGWDYPEPVRRTEQLLSEGLFFYAVSSRGVLLTVSTVQSRLIRTAQPLPR